MPRLIDADDGPAMDLQDLIGALDAADFDVNDEDSFAALGPLLARLGRNKDFLADLAITELKDRCAGQIAGNSYSAQVFLLAPPNGRYAIRANFWPARQDAVVRASGTAPFFYDLPHDHNFPFLTYGYLGPGYWSDYYEYDGATVAGLPGEAAGLRFVERARLEPERLMLYRPHRDIHVQLPPDSFSVSLNILGYDPKHLWRSQYRFDTVRGTIAEGLTVAPSEALVALAARLGGGNGRDLVENFAMHHPASRMRLTALDALASICDVRAEREVLWETAAHDADRFVAASAQTRLATNAAGQPAPLRS